jgi:hypothetical protein
MVFNPKRLTSFLTVIMVFKCRLSHLHDLLSKSRQVQVLRAVLWRSREASNSASHDFAVLTGTSADLLGKSCKCRLRRNNQRLRSPGKRRDFAGWKRYIISFRVSFNSARRFW